MDEAGMIPAPAGFLVQFILAALASWRVTHLLAAEDGPGHLIYRLRRSLGEEGWLASLADCFNCLSLFVAAPLALFLSRSPLLWALSWLALSGAACLLERMGPQGPHEAPFVDPFASQQTLEGDDHVLRRKTFDDPIHSPAPKPPNADPERTARQPCGTP